MNKGYLLKAFLLLLFSMIGGKNPATSDGNPFEEPTLIYFNGTIITMDTDQPQVEAMAIMDDKILALGDDRDILLLGGSSTTLIDLGGLAVLPGFNDSHCHWFSWREHLCSAHEEVITEYPDLEEIMYNLSANGWTSISELAFGWPGDASIEHLNNALALEASGHLSVRLNGYWGGILNAEMLDAFEGHPPDKFYSDRIRAQGIKMYVDDPFGTSDILSQEEASAIVSRAHADGWQIAVHAVNISGIEKMITAFEDVLGEQNNSEYRHRLEHAVKVTDNQLQRMLDKGLLASFQLMGPPDWPEQETHKKYISNTDPHLQMRWRDFVDMDLPSVASTDAPFNNTTCAYSPFRVIHQGVTRQGYLNRVHADWELNQRLTIAQCLKLLTVDGAYATREEEIKGSLSAGKYADFIVVSDNPLDFEENPDSLLSIDIMQTVVGGEVEYCSDLLCTNLCGEIEAFESSEGMVTVSNYLPEYRPEFAFDQNEHTLWSAGQNAPQWIQIDLQRNRLIEQITLEIGQYMEGRTLHQIWGADEANQCDLHLLHEFTGITRDRDTLVYDAVAPDTVRYLRILTRESPVHVSWFDIKFDFADEITALVQEKQLAQISIVPQPISTDFSVSFNLLQSGSMDIDLMTPDGKYVQNIFSGFLASGWHEIKSSRRSLHSGMYFLRLRTGESVWFRKALFL